jgi:bifunctional non-homologous end joining protein LigD
VWVDDVAGLVSLAQMGCAEVHSWLSRIDHPNRPDRLVFDLDPGPGVTWPQIAKAARDVRAELEALGFAVFVKSTGSKGLHVVAPVEPVWEFTRMRALAKTIAERIALAHPDELTPKMAKSKREGRIFLDYVRNSEAASAVLPYSTRFLPGPSIAVPLAFDELTDDLDVRAFTPDVVAKRVSAGIDPWAALDDSAVGSRVLKAAEGRLF